MESCTLNTFYWNKWTAQTLKIRVLFLPKCFWVVVFLIAMLAIRNTHIFSIYIILHIKIKIRGLTTMKIWKYSPTLKHSDDSVL